MYPTVAIIGSGASGLVAAKECIASGLVPTLFEKQSELGGIWNGSGVWNSMQTNVSRFTSTFSDFEWPSQVPLFPKWSQVQDYLNSYAQKFKLMEYIKFNTMVTSVKRMQNTTTNGEWLVEYELLKETREKFNESFDFVIISSGVFTTPDIPKINKMNVYEGKIFHSKDYKYSQDECFLDKTVLVVGGSFSGAEIASDLTNGAKTVINLIKRPFWILTKHIPINPTDKKRKLPVDFVFYDNKPLFSNETTTSNESNEDLIKKNNLYLSMICEDQMNMGDIAHPDLTQPPHVLISDTYLNDLTNKRIQVEIDQIDEFSVNGVHLKSGKHIKCDCVIFATGYTLNLNYLEKPILDAIEYESEDKLIPLILYKCTFCPSLDSLGFVGIYRGPYWGIMELQARWIAKIFSKKLKLKSINSVEVASFMENERKTRNARPRPQFPHGDYVQFSKTIAEELGEYPNGFDEVKLVQPELYKSIVNNSFIPAFFRLTNLNEEKIRTCKSQISQMQEIIKNAR